MSTFPAVQVDQLLKACVEFHEEHDHYFAVGNIAGRGGVTSDLKTVKDLMDWVVQTDDKLLAFQGNGLDGVPYYRLGRDARDMLTAGGFQAYLDRRKSAAFLGEASKWLSVVASIAAVVVAALAWQAPKGNDDAIKAMEAKLSALETQLGTKKAQEDSAAADFAKLKERLELRLDSIESRIKKGK